MENGKVKLQDRIKRLVASGYQLAKEIGTTSSQSAVIATEII